MPGPSGRLFQSSGEEDDRRFRALEVRIFASSLLSRRILSAAQVLRAGVWPRQTAFPSFYLGISLTGPWIRFPWILWWWLRALCNLPGSSDTVVLSPGLRFGAVRGAGLPLSPRTLASLPAGTSSKQDWLDYPVGCTSEWPISSGFRNVSPHVLARGTWTGRATGLGDPLRLLPREAVLFSCFPSKSRHRGTLSAEECLYSPYHSSAARVPSRSSTHLPGFEAFSGVGSPRRKSGTPWHSLALAKSVFRLQRIDLPPKDKSILNKIRRVVFRNK